MVDNKFVIPFVNSVKNLFSKTLKIDVNEKLPYIIEEGDEMDFDIVSIIGLSGEVKGSVIMAFKKDIALAITKKYWGGEIVDFNEEVFDTIAELVNIISGNAKQGIEKYKIYISLPSVITGKSLSAINSNSKSKTPLIMIPFSSEIGDLSVILSYKVI